MGNYSSLWEPVGGQYVVNVRVWVAYFFIKDNELVSKVKIEGWMMKAM